MKPYYEENGIKIYHCDCGALLPQFEVGSVDLVVTSPPYNMGNSTGAGLHQFARGHYLSDAGIGQRGGSGRWRSPQLANGYGVHSDSMPHAEYVAWQKEILLKCWRLLPDHGAIYYNHKPRVLGGQVVTPLEYNPDLPVRQIVIWARGGGINCTEAHYVSTHEWIVIFAKPDFRLRDKGASGVGDVWRIQQEANTPHPAPFPLALPRRVLETTMPKLVLDPFCGSGTTLVAAQSLDIGGIGIDNSEEYCEMAAKRLMKHRGCTVAAQASLLDGAGFAAAD